MFLAFCPQSQRTDDVCTGAAGFFVASCLASRTPLELGAGRRCAHSRGGPCLTPNGGLSLSRWTTQTGGVSLGFPYLQKQGCHSAKRCQVKKRQTPVYVCICPESLGPFKRGSNKFHWVHPHKVLGPLSCKVGRRHHALRKRVFEVRGCIQGVPM